ncbi:rRNA maturation RNase YbeY [Treponema sp. OttesenSCG-928-L16]|nr:rRNA maturation RNase YbeY [Treponema sp. OttesenSCG-928-L16]
MNRVEVSVEGVPPPEWTDALKRFASKVLTLLGKHNWDLSLLLCDNTAIRSLNARFRDRDEATDVLSFELGESFSGEGEERYLPGDIAISLETLRENAAFFAVPEDEELRRLVVHGILHLDGRDHSTNDQNEAMLQIQEKILRELSGEHILT